MTESGLTPRTIEVLHSIVQSYIETGEPVASRTIARRRRDHLSPATIRNIMADLADAGYLDQPHTSAGRVPTAKAFRHYALAVSQHRPSGADLARVREELIGHPGVEERTERTTHILTELTRNVSIVAAIPAAGQTLDRVELVWLSDRRILMVVMTGDGMVRNQLALLKDPISPAELESIRNYLNVEFAGWTMTAIRSELDRRLAEERAAYDQMLLRLSLFYQQGLLDMGTTPLVFLDGASNLLGIDVHLTAEKLRELFRTLEEKRRLIDMLDQFLAGRTDELQVRVGLSEAHPALSHFSLIGLRIGTPGGVETRLAVLGPMRMNYARVVSTVFQIGHLLRSLPQ
ncbi:MAG: heat-inducible transcriptional repressor HrcA [Bryobacter sp.]|nr:heat-inducible transcriptional repressor HrcA [Bryobacter sp.]